MKKRQVGPDGPWVTIRPAEGKDPDDEEVDELEPCTTSGTSRGKSTRSVRGTLPWNIEADHFYGKQYVKRNEGGHFVAEKPVVDSEEGAKGNVFPLKSVRCTLFAMNRRLADHRIRSTCRELLASGARLTGRGLRRELRDRYGAVGQTARVFQIWREESAASQAPAVPADVAQMAERLHAAETAAATASARAERAELREEAHQTRWAMEIDGLRQQLRAQPQYAAEIRRLQDQVMRLTVELHAARRQLAQPE